MKKIVFVSLSLLFALLCMNFVSAEVIEQEDSEFELIQEINPEYFKGESTSKYAIRISDDNEMKLCNYVITEEANYITATCRDLQLGAEYFLFIKDTVGNIVKYELRLYENPRMLFVQDNTQEAVLNIGALELQLYKRVLGEEIGNGDEVHFIDEEGYTGVEVMYDPAAKIEPVGDSLIIDF